MLSRVIKVGCDLIQIFNLTYNKKGTSLLLYNGLYLDRLLTHSFTAHWINALFITSERKTHWSKATNGL